MAKNIRVVPNGGNGWNVKREGVDRVIRNFDLQKKAETFGRQIVRRDHVEFTLCGKDGKVRDRDTYSGKDPFPPRDKEH